MTPRMDVWHYMTLRVDVWHYYGDRVDRMFERTPELDWNLAHINFAHATDDCARWCQPVLDPSCIRCGQHPLIGWVRPEARTYWFHRER